MSIPGLNPFVPPVQDPPPVPPQIVAPRPASPTLRNRPAGQGDAGQEDASSERGLKRGRPTEADAEGMDIETSSEPATKRRRGGREVATPEQPQVQAEAIDPMDTFTRDAQEVFNACQAVSSHSRMTPLVYAASKGFESVVRYLVESSTYQQINIALLHAVKSGHLNIVQVLHTRGGNLFVKDTSSKGCLHYAVESGDLEVLEWLLKKSVDVDSPTASGVTPLMQACGKGNGEVVHLLRAHQANFAARDSSGRTCLHYAVESCDLEVLKSLLEQGVSVEVSAHSGLTPLMQACGKGHIEVARLLHEYRANLAAKDALGRNGLYYAAAHGQQAVVDWLLEQGAPADEPDSEDKTPIYIAFSKRYWPVVNSLLAVDVKFIRKISKNSSSAVGGIGLFGMPLMRHYFPEDDDKKINFAKDIFDEAIKDGQYQILLSLYQKQPHIFSQYKYKSLKLRDQPTYLRNLIEDESDDEDSYSDDYDDEINLRGQIRLSKNFSSDHFLNDDRESKTSRLQAFNNLSALHAEVRDLIRIFNSLEKSDSSAAFQWLSDSNKSKRENFFYKYMDAFKNIYDIKPTKFWIGKRKEIFSYDVYKTNQRPIFDRYFMRHSLFSYVVHHCLVPDYEKWMQLTTALSGWKNYVCDAQKQNILLYKMKTLKASSQFKHTFSEKQLSPELEERLQADLLQKLDGMILAMTESLALESAEFDTRFTELCKKYIDISGYFRSGSFTQALEKLFGIYVVNAHRLTALVSHSMEIVGRQPLDLPPVGSVDRVLSISGQQIFEKVIVEFKKLLTQMAKAYEMPDEIKGSEVVESVEDDSYPISLSAQLKKSLNQSPVVSELPGFTERLDGLEQEEQDLYVNLIFDQWRKINAALGVVLRDPLTVRVESGAGNEGQDFTHGRLYGQDEPGAV